MMTARFSLFVLLSFTVFTVFAQPKKVNGPEVLKQARELYSQSKYKEVVKLLKTIPRADTTYQDALFTMAFANYLDSNFTESMSQAQEGMRRYPEKSDEWWSLIADNLDLMEKPDEAIVYYDKIIATYRHPYLAWFNKGITYVRQKKYADAKKCLQQCLLINPYYSSAHYSLGTIAYDEGNMVAAMLSYTACLLVSPEGKYSARSITQLSAISKATDSTVKKAAAYKAGSTDNFEEIQEILLSKIALDRQYKLKTDLEDPIVRQLQVVMEKLKYNSSDKGFWMQYYVPLFETALKEDQFETMVYFIFSSVEISDIQKYIKRNKSKINDVAKWYGAYFNEIRGSQVLEPTQRKNVTEKVEYYDGSIFGKGKTEGEGSKAMLTGPWEFYYSNGQVKSKGILSSKQEKNGEWLFYYSNGKMKEKTIYTDGKANGKTVAWYDNGLKLMDGTYKDGEPDGKATFYYYNGLLKKTTAYKGGKVEGNQGQYTSDGYLKEDANYKEGKEDGQEVTYYKNGQKASVINYAKGEPEGQFKKYYDDGTLKMEGTITNGKRSGTWKEYHLNGKIKNITNYVADQLEGEYKQYYDNGQLLAQSAYAKDKLEGKYEDFDVDGKVFSESYYEKGRLKDLKFFDKKGNVISSSTSRNGAGNFTFYDPEGNKTSEGYFNKDGSRNGKATFYYRSGKVKAEANYKDGLLDGERVAYFLDGTTVSARNQYKNDEENGYQITYYINGNKRHEGEVIKGMRQGLHIDYDLLGNVYSKTDYKDGDIDGFVEYYHPSGKKDYEVRYESGWVMSVTQFDTTGKAVSDFDLKEGAAKFNFKNYVGGNFIEAAYKACYLHGEHKTFFPNGSPSLVQYYHYGNKDSITRKYLLNGKIDYEGTYRADERHGKWTFYHDNGQLYYTETYKDGHLNGVTKLYKDDGSLDRELPYKEGSFHGEYKYYGENNQLAAVLYYENGYLRGYSYEDKTGKLVPMIPLKNGTGKVLGYYKNGTKSVDIDFLDDDFEGKRNIYFTNGKPYVEGNRVAGDDHGLKKVYYANGQLKIEETYLYGNLHGAMKTFWENGKLKTEETYYNGDRHGVKKVYDNTGKLIQTLTYYFGTLQVIK